MPISADIQVFRIPSFCTKSGGQCSFCYQAPTTWNQFPVSVCHATCVSSFKSSLKTILLSKAFSSVPLLQDVSVCVHVSCALNLCQTMYFERICKRFGPVGIRCSKYPLLLLLQIIFCNDLFLSKTLGEVCEKKLDVTQNPSILCLFHV